MTRVVWKYELRGTRNEVDLPRESVVVHVAGQVKPNGERGIFMWVEVDPEETELRRRTFHIVGTGQPLPPSHWLPRHLGTFLSDDLGTFVFHLYETPWEHLDSDTLRDTRAEA